MKRFVVGVNRCPASHDALSWAYGAAVRESAPLEVVTVYRPVVVVSPLDGYVLVDDRNALQGARATQLDALSAVLGGHDAEARIDCLVLVGDPVSVLVDRAEHASLLIVGRRRRRWSRWLWPSTSTLCADRSSCPVVIVREQRPINSRQYRAELRRLERDLRQASPLPTSATHGATRDEDPGTESGTR